MPPDREKLSEIIAALRVGLLPGEALGSIEIPPQRLRLLRAYVRGGLKDPPEGNRQRVLLGAAIFLAGVLAFKDAPAESSWTYETVQKWLDPEGSRLPDFRLGAEIGRFYELIAHGAQTQWDITLLHGRTGNRLFQGTMLLHSGAGDAIVVDVAEHADKLGGWMLIRDSEPADLAARLAQLPLRGYQRAALGSEDTRTAVAERLKEVAVARDTVLMLGAVSDSPEATFAGIVEAGLRTAFDIDRDDLLRKLVGILFPTGTADSPTAPTFRWCWDLTGARPGLAIDAPVALPCELFPGADRVALRIANGTERIFYRPEGSRLNREGDRSRLAVTLAPPVTVVGVGRVLGRAAEVELAALAFPGVGFALFLADRGAQVRAAPPGTKVVLVAEPGWEIQPPDTFRPTGSGGAWIGSMPEAAVDLGEGLQLAPAGKRLTVTLQGGKPVPGLSLERSTVYQEMPRAFAFGVDRGQGRLIGPGDGVIDIPLRRFRAGRVPLPDQTHPGRYRLELRGGGRTGVASFFLLPPEICEIRARRTLAGTDLTTQGSAPVRITLGANTGIGGLRLPQFESGNVRLDLEIGTEPVWRGAFELQVGALAARLQADPEGVLLPSPTARQPVDARVLQAGGGIRVFGPPRQEAVLELAGRKVTVTIGSCGSSFVPFSDLLVGAFPEKEVLLRVRWGTVEQRVGPFVREADDRPDMVVDGRLVRLKLRTAATDVRMKIVSAWQPWEPARLVDTTLSLRGEETWYEALLDDVGGPVQVRLVEIVENGEIAVTLTGMRLVGWSDLPPPELLPLEHALWTDAPQMLGLLADRIAEDRDGAFLRGLIDRIRDDGREWFKASGILDPRHGPSAAGAAINAWRLDATLVPRDGGRDRGRVEWLDAQGPAWLWLRFRDLKAEFDRVHPDAIRDRIGPLLEGTGLLVPVFRLFGWRPPSTGSMRPAPGAPPDPLIGYLPRSLRSEDYEILRQPGEVRPPDLGPDQSRLAGLLEAHLFLQAKPEFEWNEKLAYGYAEFGYLTENQIPTRERAIEAEVVQRTAVIHAWRRGSEPRPLAEPAWLDRTLQCYRCFPRLVDYWLNRHSVREFP